MSRFLPILCQFYMVFCVVCAEGPTLDFDKQAPEFWTLNSPQTRIGGEIDVVKLNKRNVSPHRLLNIHIDHSSRNNGTIEKPVNISETCWSHYQDYLLGLGLGEEWALRMADAEGTQPAGQYQGVSSWPGVYGQCVEVKAPDIDGSQLFEGQYCTAIYDSMLQLTVGNWTGFVKIGDLSIGKCVPSSCSNEDVFRLIKAGAYGIPQAPTFELRPTGAECQMKTIPLDAPAIGVICMLSFIGAVLLIATAYDILFHQLKIRRSARLSDFSLPKLSRNSFTLTTIENGNLPKKLPYEHNNGSVHVKMSNPDVIKETGVHVISGADSKHASAINGHISQNGIAPMNENTATNAKVNSEKINKDEDIGVMVRLLLSLSVYSNGKKMLTATESKDSLGCVNGIRVISLTWVILGHSYSTSATFLRNIAVMGELFKRFTFQAIGNGTVSVDTFFLLSGFLSTYLMMKELKRRGGPLKFNWLLFYFHRIWRLTPPYMIILGANTALFKYFGEGPFWLKDGVEPFCKKNWHLNLFYVNNLVRPTEMCLPVSWYLANDMQFFVISPLLIIPLFISWKIGVPVVLAVMLGCFIGTGIRCYDLKFGAYTGPQTEFWIEYYVAPWARIGPYLVGILLGYILYRTGRKVKLPKVLVLLGWLAAAGSCIGVLYGLYGERNGHYKMSLEVATLYNVVSRSVWAVGVGWVIFACSTGNGGIINSFLSWKPFVVLGRLSFMAYLTHVIVIMFYYFNRQTLFFYTDINMVWIYLGSLVLSMAFAFAASLTLESPWMGLEKVLLRKYK